MHNFVFHNDRVLPLAQVRLSPGQAGLFNGWGVFTTLRVYDGMPFAFERHWNRLSRDANRVQLPLTYEQGAVRESVQQVIKANRIQSACMRIYFIYNKVSIWQSDESFPRVDLIIYSIDLPVRAGPTELAVMAHGRHAANPLTGVKMTAWLNNAWHVEQAHRLGFDDAVLLNEHGAVVESTAANIFCVHGQKVITPPSSSGCLLGVTREILLELARKSGIDIEEQTFSLQQLYDADEVFITSTTRNVQPIQRVGDTEIRRAPGPVTERLAAIFSDFVNDFIGKRPRFDL